MSASSVTAATSWAGLRSPDEVEIGDYASVGTNATILPDVRVGRGAYIGAGAVVTKDVPELAVCVGVPARVVRQQELRANLEEIDKL